MAESAVRHLAPRVLVVAYPAVTTLVVVATGNHFFLDAVAGAVLAWVAVGRVARPRRRRGGEQGPRPGESAREELPRDRRGNQGINRAIRVSTGRRGAAA